MSSFEYDLYTIENDLIAKQIDGKYMKFSRALNAVAIIGMTRGQYTYYWANLHSNNSQHCSDIINACNEKFENNLLTREEMIELIVNSNDNTADKPKALRLLGIKT